jgi:hypothetical protein
MNRAKLWLDRVGIVLFTVVALGAPFVFGFVYYLGVTDGIELNVGDPLRESRIWMQKEKRGPTSIGWQRAEPAGQPLPGVQCARSQLTVLSWRGGLSLDNSVTYCKCYESTTSGFRESTVTCT